MRIPSTGQAVARHFPPPTPQPGHRASHAVQSRSSAVGRMERQLPPALAPLPEETLASRAPHPRGPRTALGALSACRSAADIRRVVEQYPGVGTRLVKQRAFELMARIATNTAFSAEIKLANLQALVNFVGGKNVKADFVTQDGQLQLHAIVDPFAATPGILPSQVARLLVALEELPKAVSPQQARALLQQAHGPGWRAPDFGVFAKLHAKNHFPGEKGGVYVPHLRSYVYPNGEKFWVRTIRADPVVPPGRFNGVRQAMALAVPSNR